jgi:steroid delta-isomerase-like uncharacterized protein
MALATPARARVARYFDAWNQHDPAAVVAAFAPGGTYTDPTVAGTRLSGDSLASYASALFTGFPDLTFDVERTDTVGDERVISRWRMHGTNTGPFRGAPPTGKVVSLPGVDFIALAAEGICSVEGIFDRQMLAEQLGLQVLVQPHAAGPFTFGYGVRATGGSRAQPGAFSLTWIDARSAAEADEVRSYSRPLVADLARAPGFISSLRVGIANRLFTITAWETADAARQVMQHEVHQRAMARFFSEDFGAAIYSGMWTVDRQNPLWMRCSACARLVDMNHTTEACGCGQPLPAPPAYW